MGPYQDLTDTPYYTVIIANRFSAGIDFKSIPALKETKCMKWPWAHNIGIQMKQNELNKTFMMISKWVTLWSP